MPDSPDTLISAILAYGDLLNANSSRPWRRASEERNRQFKEREQALVAEIETAPWKGLRPIFDFNAAGKHVDPVSLRAICLVAAAQFASPVALDPNVVARAASVDADPCQ